MAEPLAQALELCMWSVTDLDLLVRLSLVSKAAQGICKAHVQQHLPVLLGSDFDDWERRHSAVPYNIYTDTPRDKALRWLYRSAGPAVVGTPTAALAVLRLAMRIGQTYSENIILRRVAVQHGMQLTADVLVAAAKERIQLIGWVDDYASFPAWRAEAQLPPLAALPPHLIAAARGKAAVLAPLLPSINPQQMSDLLHLAVNGFDNKGASAVVQQLLQHDKQHTHVPHSSHSCSTNDDTDSTETVMISCSSIMLVEQLIATSIIRQHQSVVQQLGDTPAARPLTAGAVLKLLYLAMQQEPRFQGLQCSFQKDNPTALEGDSSSSLHAVCRMPAAGAISVTSICSLIKITWSRRQYGSVGRLLSLPQAAHLTSQQFAGLLLRSCKALLRSWQDRYAGDSRTHATILQRLVALQSSKQLAPGDAYVLMKEVLQVQQESAASSSKHSVMCQLLEELAPLNLGSQLTGSELLELLKVAAGHGCEVCLKLVSLKPAADEIGDEVLYTSVLQDLMDSAKGKGPDSSGRWPHDALNTIAQAIPFTQHLGVNSVALLLHHCATTQVVHDFLWQIPALQQLSAEAIGRLLLQAAQTGFMNKLQPLLDVRAATQLTTELLLQLIDAVLEELKVQTSSQSEWRVAVFQAPDIVVLGQLLAMPAAVQLTIDDIASALLQTSALVNELEMRLQSRDNQRRIPIQLASFMSKLLQLPAAQQIALGTVVQILQAAIAAGSTKQVDLFGGLPVAVEISGCTAKQLLETALEKGDLKMLQMLQECVPQVAAVAATMQPTREQLQKQIASAIAQENEQALAELCQHSKAAEISPAGMVELLLHVRSCKDHLQKPFLQRLLETQVAQDLDPDAVADIWQSCISGRRLFMTCISLVAQLPGAAKVETKCCETMLDFLLSWMVSCPGAPSQEYASKKADVLHTIECILQLPVMQALPADKVAQRLQWVMQQAHLMSNLADKLSSMFQMILSRLPGSQQLSQHHLKGMMQNMVECKDSATFTLLSRMPSAPKDDDVQAWGVLLGLTEF